MGIRINFKYQTFLILAATLFLMAWIIIIFSSVYSNYLFKRISNIDEARLAKYESSLDSLDKDVRRMEFIVKGDPNLNLILADNYAEKGIDSIKESDERTKNSIREEVLNMNGNTNRNIKKPALYFINGIRFYQKAIIGNPLSVESHIRLGILYANLQINDKACKEFEKAAFLDPTNAYNQIEVGEYLLSIGEYDKAFKSLKKANSFLIQLLPESLEMVWDKKNSYEDLKKITPETPSALEYLGSFLLEKEMWDEAIEVFKKGISINPKNSYLYKTLSSTYEKKKMWDESVRLLNDGIKKNPENPDMYFYLGLAYSKKNEIDQAIYNIDKAIKLFKSGSDKKPLIEYHKMLGHIYYNQVKDYNKALEESNIALKLNPFDGGANFLQGLCYKSMDSDPAKMLDFFEKAVKYSPYELQYRIFFAENLFIYGLYEKARTEWEAIKGFESQEKIAEAKIKEIDNRIREERKDSRFDYKTKETELKDLMIKMKQSR